MTAYIEIRWHGRAQQGVVTAAKVLGEACLRLGKYVQAFPEFGPESMGAPVRAFNRISSEPIRLHCQVTEPKYVLIADSTLIGTALSKGIESSGSVTEGATEDAVFIVNTPKSPDEMRSELGLKGKKAHVYTVDTCAFLPLRPSSERISSGLLGVFTINTASSVAPSVTLPEDSIPLDKAVPINVESAISTYLGSVT